MFTKSTVQIGSITADVFICQEYSHYYYSLTSAAALIGKPPLSAFQFLNSKAFKSLHSEGFTPFHFEGDNGTEYKLLPCEAVLAYLIHWCAKANGKALGVVTALATESLELRAAKAFGQLTMAKVAEVQLQTDEALATKARKEAKDEHNAFQRACWQLGFQPAIVHDYLTKKVFGYAAYDARRLPPSQYQDKVWHNVGIGINHHADPLLMEVYRAVKRRFLSYRKGTYTARIDRAYQELTEDVMLG